MQIRSFQDSDEKAVIALWEQCALVTPLNDPSDDISRKLQVNPELFLVGVIDGQVVATVMAGYEGHRGWINYLAVAPRMQRQGLGRQMMAAAEERLRAAGCPKVNLLVRSTNQYVLGFYAALGYVRDEVVSMGKRLEGS